MKRRKRRGSARGPACAAALMLLALACSAAALTWPRAARAAGTATPPELVLQTGHAFRVDALAFSPDGRLLASGSADNTVRLWETATGRELRGLAGHTLYVKALAFSPDGRLLASGAADGKVKLWDVETGREARGLAAGVGVTSLSFGEDGGLLASGDADGTVKVWEVESGREARALKAHAGQVTALAFAPGGRLLASGGKEGAVKLWEVASGREARALKAHASPVKSLAFDARGERLASAGSEQAVKVWNAETGAEERALAGRSPKAVAVAFGAGGGELLAAGSDRAVTAWDVKTWRESRPEPGRAAEGEPASEAAAFSRDGALLATSNGDKTVLLRETRAGAPERVFGHATAGLYAAAFSPDGRWFATGGKDRTVRIWEVSTGRKVRVLAGHTGWVTCLAFSPDGRRLVAGSLSGAARLWDARTGALLRTLEGHAASVNGVAFSPDSRRVFTGGGDATVRAWDAESGRELLRFEGHAAEVNAVAVSPDGRALASGGADKTVRLWDLETGRETRQLAGQDGEVYALAFGPGGKSLAAGGKDGALKIWNVGGAAADDVRLLGRHGGGVRAVAFSPDGARLASGGSDASVRLWDSASGRVTAEAAGHTDGVNGVAFSADGRWLSTVGEDGAARLWEASTGEPRATLVALAGSADWLVVTPEGLFDGSPAAWDRILWRFAGSTLGVAPVESFFNEFFYPDLLAEILAGRRPRPAQDIGRIDRRLPTVGLSLAGGQAGAGGAVSSREVTVKLEVEGGPAGARDLRLFRNGSLVKAWRGEVAAPGGRATLEATLPVVAGENRLTTYAFNRDNVKSRDASLEVAGSDALRRTGTTYVLAVGVNAYADPRYDLRYAVADARDFAEEVRRQRALLEPQAPSETVFLLDGEATKANVLAALGRLAGTRQSLPAGAPVALERLRPAQPEDAVVIFFAGHGTARGERFYLLPHDLAGASGLEETLARGLSDQELESALEPLAAGQLVFVIDACNSGRALDAAERRRGPMNSKGLAQLAYEKGMYVLTASQSHQAALEAAELGHGFLTYALVEEGLRRGEADAADSRDGRVLVREWFDYAAARVPQMQTGRMQQARGLTVKLTFAADGSQDVQRPRAFYRREAEARPLVVARVDVARAGK